MCKKRRLPPTSLGVWLWQAEDDKQVATMDAVPLFIRWYHAQQAVEKLLKAAIIVTVGSFQKECPEIVRRRKQCPPKKENERLGLPACAWALPSNFDFPKIHDLCKLWNILRKHAGAEFSPLSEDDKNLMNKATQYATCCRYPAYRTEVGSVVGYALDPPDEVLRLIEKYSKQLRDYVIRRSQK